MLQKKAESFANLFSTAGSNTEIIYKHSEDLNTNFVCKTGWIQHFKNCYKSEEKYMMKQKV